MQILRYTEEMSEIVLLTPERFGYGFISEKYLPKGTNEYYLRDLQVDAPRHSWRNLTSDEITRLENAGNSSTDWNHVLVEDPFNVSVIKNSLFAGLVRIGPMAHAYLQYHDFTTPVGITNSRIISCDIGENCAIHDCANLSHYIMEKNVILSRIDEMATTDHAKFGEGILKEGESESVRLWIEPMNEAGGRPILPFTEMIAADAYLWAVYRDDAKLMDRLKEITQGQADARRGYYGTIGEGSVIKSCLIIKDVMVGPSAYIKGANKLKNLTIRSTAAEPTQIGEGCELVNGIIGLGCRVFYGVKAIRFVLGNNSSLKYGARLIHSVLGDNSTISCCEVLNNLVFPAHEQHHNNSFLIATLVMGQSNMAAGATVGSNHNSRGNDGEIVAGRGFWPGLSSTLKHNCRFASFILLTKGSYPAELNIMFPFAMVLDNPKYNRLEVMPAYYWLYNMYALERNSWKYRSRDKRKTIVQRVETDHLAPDTVCEMIDALALLERWTGKAWYVSEGSGDSIPCDATLEAKGRELIVGSPDVVSELFVAGEMMERGPRQVRILKVVESWHAYRQMLLYYAVRTIARYLSDYGIHYGFFQARVPETVSLKWVNMGGQLVPEEKVDALRAGIRTGLFNTWADIHSQYDQWWGEYPIDRANNAYAVLRFLTKLQTVSGEDWDGLLDEALAIRQYVEEQVYVTKEKDYSNAFRGITYRNEAERDAVLGRVDDNAFIQIARMETQEFNEMIEKVRV